MVNILPLTGNCESDKRIVYDAIRKHASALGCGFHDRPIDDFTQYSFEISPKDFPYQIQQGSVYSSLFEPRNTNWVIVCSGDRKGKDIWLGISGTTYGFFNGTQADVWKRGVIIVDGIRRHVLYVPFSLLKSEMEPHYPKGYLQYHFHILDPSARFSSYATKRRKKPLGKYLDNMDGIFPN